MVVNRKQPVAPIPLVQSRSTSQQPIIMRKKQSRYTTSNGIDPRKPGPEPSTNSDPKPKSTSRPRPRKRWLRGKLFVWSLSLFALYSFLFCSSYTTTPQQSQSHFICRAETRYKTYILDPVILPPLQHALSFSHSLAEPYISHANTHLEPYLAPVKQVTSTIKPYVIQTATAIKRVWEATLIPLYKNTLKPYYQLAILPRYKLYLRPYLLPLINHLERHYVYYVSNPIRIQVNRIQLHFSTIYTTYIRSYIAHLQPYIRRFTSAVHTACLSSVYLYGTYIRPTLQSTWTQAQPHLSFAFDQAKDISLNAAAGTAKCLKGLAKQVGIQRRSYVDPHIRKIWDKVEENATAKTMATPAPVDISLEEEIAKSAITASLITDEVVSPIANTKEPIKVPVPEENAQDGFHPVKSTLPPLASAPPHSTTQEEVQSAHASTVLSELEREIETHGSNVAEATISATFENSEQSPKVISKGSVSEVSVGAASSSPSPNTSGGVMGVGASSPPPSDSTLAAEDDLDDFLRDIGWDTPSSSPSPTLTQPSEVDEAAASASAQEAEASRLASIASKRLAITTRHAALETELQSSILASTSQIIERLKEMREAKKEELMGLIQGTSEGEVGFVADLTSSGDKLMKGLDIYLKKCQGRSGTWKKSSVVGSDNKGEDDDIPKRTGIAKDEQARFESVIDKVEAKFSDGVQKLQEQVHGWYLGMVEKEQEEISQVAIKIKNMAEQAQASLGTDYAWLEDVSYSDWQRYHDLVRASDKFEQTANAIQNGTSVDPRSPPNPIKPIITDLQEELHTVILGFYVALGNVKNTIPELFSIYESVLDPEREDGAGEEDKVRIQPVNPDLGGENAKENTRQNEGFAASQFIIGKSKEQIEQALGDVPVQHGEL